MRSQEEVKKEDRLSEKEILEKKGILARDTNARDKTRKRSLIQTITQFKPKKPMIPVPGKVGNKISTLFAKRALIIGLILLVVLIVGAFAAWWFYPKAQVTVYLSTKRLEEKITITVDPDTDTPNLSESIIPGNTLRVEVEGDDTKSTTGTKTVGEKAKGEVVLYRVGTSITLSAGVEINGPSNLTFTLDENTTLASGSAGSAGTTKAQVTASDLGAQYNLASGTTFSVGNYSTSDIEAKNESAFTGGSSREISTVSEDDQKNLESELNEELLEKAKEELTTDLTEDSLFIDESLTGEVSEKDFSHKVGDEASTLKLSMTLSAKALVVDEHSLTDLAKEVLKDRVPDGFVLRSEQIEMEFEVDDVSDERYELTAFVEANLLPEVDPQALATKIRGKYPSLAENYLTKETPGFVRAEIILKPRLPGRLGTLPHVLKNIEVEIAAER